MKIAVVLFAVCLCLATISTRCADAQPGQCAQDKKACLCPNGETGICRKQECEMCEPITASRRKRGLFPLPKRGLFPFPFRARCRNDSGCGSICQCQFKRCCCPWHQC